MTLGRTLSNARSKVLGTLIFYDPRQDIADGIDGSAYGPGDATGGEFDLKLALHPAMGPGGVL